MIVKMNGQVVCAESKIVSQAPGTNLFSKEDFAVIRKVLIGASVPLALIPSLALAADEVSIMSELRPVYNVLGEFVAAIGGIVFFGGAITMYFRRKTGMEIMKMTGLVILIATFIPSIIMLLVIIGRLFDKVLTKVLEKTM